MDYKQKYLKYKMKYLELNNEKAKKSIYPKIMKGGNITWATPEYIEQIISSKRPDLTKCDLIKDVVPKENEGRNNSGIGFVTIEGKEYFLKYGYDLYDDFRTGYLLSKLKPEYPYFLNVYSLFKCDYIPRRDQESINGQVMVVDKGSETIYYYLNRKSKEYILNLIPDLEIRVNQLDEEIIKIINDNLTNEEKSLYDYEFKKRNLQKYNDIVSKINELVRNFYLSLSREIIQFQTEFVPLFIRNYKTLIDSYIAVDIFTLNKYNNYIGDKKSDNFMVITEPYEENKTHINIKLGSTNIKIKNVCEWINTKEYCFLYPVDFGSEDNMNHPKLNDVLLPYFLNDWIKRYSNLSLFSDNINNDLESGNILLLNGNEIEFKFSKFSKFSFRNEITELSVETILRKNNPFKIKIFDPLKFYFCGMESNNNNCKRLNKSSEQNPLEELLEQNPLEENDYGFQSKSDKFYNIKTLEEACEILQTLLSGYTLIYNEEQEKYCSYSNVIDFYGVNGLGSNTYLSNDDVYKTFYAS